MNPEHLHIELDHERRVSASPRLSVFRRNATAWELLLMLAEQGEGGDGLYNLAEQVQTDHLSAAAMLKFMRDRRKDGLLHFEQHEKRSKWRVLVDDDLLDELHAHLELRNRLLLKASRSRRR